MWLRRSIVWCNGQNEDETKRYLQGEADGLCIDLEDTVTPPFKPQARKVAVNLLRTLDFGRKERIVRVNEFGSEEFQRDMADCIAIEPPDTVRVPKCEYAEDMKEIDRQLREIEEKHGLAPNTIEVIAMIETPMGVRNAYEIAASCERVTAINLGMEDLTNEMGISRRYEHNELDLLYARQKVVLDAKAAGVQILDSVLLLVGQDDVANRQSEESKQMGFTGRSCRNSEQAAFANKTFSPTAEEIEAARGIIASFDSAAAEGRIRPQYDGKYICLPHYKKAKNIIALAERIAELEKK